jgi:hypothetical protein
LTHEWFGRCWVLGLTEVLEEIFGDFVSISPNTVSTSVERLLQNQVAISFTSIILISYSGESVVNEAYWATLTFWYFSGRHNGIRIGRSRGSTFGWGWMANSLGMVGLQMKNQIKKWRSIWIQIIVHHCWRRLRFEQFRHIGRPWWKFGSIHPERWRRLSSRRRGGSLWRRRAWLNWRTAHYFVPVKSGVLIICRR